MMDGGFYYQVRAGEWVSKIAATHGFRWQDVWNDPHNGDLRSLRKDPNVVYPGDLLYIPMRKLREQSATTDNQHLYQLTLPKKKLKIVLRDWEGRPRGDLPCRLEIDHRVCAEVKYTDSQGQIIAMIAEGATDGLLYVGQDPEEVYQVLLGHLDPIDTAKGQQQRLVNLGHYRGKIDGMVGVETRKAITSFQEFENFQAGQQVLKVDGILGPKTRAKLQERHGY